MNIGGEPERDDYGLPPVDIEIPDDARELDRDLQAYRRELRAQRRLRLVRRLGGPLARDGMVLPLLASCLALTLLIGTLLTMFTASRAIAPVTTTASTGGAAAVGEPGGPLPAAKVRADGKIIPLRSLHPAVLAIVPAGCGCAAAALRLSRQAASAHVKLFFVGTGTGVSTAATLASQAGLNASHVLSDARDTLGHAYLPVELTAILVDPDGLVASIKRELTATLQLTRPIRALSSSSPQSLQRFNGERLADSQRRLTA